MGRKIIDLTGKQFTYLTVIERTVNVGNRTKWICRCNCGNMTIVDGADLVRGKVTSCGCIRATHAIKHNASYSRLYKIFVGMKTRCYDQKHHTYKYYGAKGITICDEWLSNFEVFQEWALANGYKDNLTIERKDNLLGYCPNNCTWITIQEQAINRRPRRKTIK